MCVHDPGSRDPPCNFKFFSPVILHQGFWLNFSLFHASALSYSISLFRKLAHSVILYNTLLYKMSQSVLDIQCMLFLSTLAISRVIYLTDFICLEANLILPCHTLSGNLAKNLKLSSYLSACFSSPLLPFAYF